MKIPYVAMLFILSSVLVLVCYALYAVFKYTRMIGNIFLGLVYNPPVEGPFSGARGEAVTILDTSDTEIETLFLDRPDAKGTVIFCHESGSSKESWEKYAAFLPERGYRILSVDFKSGAESGAAQAFFQWPVERDVKRLLTAVRWVKKVCSPTAPIILFGVSKGSDIALAASFHDPAIKAVIADGLFSMKEIFRDYIRKWAPVLVRPNFFGDKTPEWIVRGFASLGFWYSQESAGVRFVDVESLLGKRRAPLLMIYGRQDSYVPAGHQDYLEKVGRDATLERFIVASAGHNEAVVKDRASYEKKITEFLSKL